MLDAVIELLPSPVDIPPVQGVDEREQPASRKADDSEKFSALAFKLMTDPFVGQLTFIRVYSGVLNSGATVYNSVKGKKYCPLLLQSLKSPILRLSLRKQQCRLIWWLNSLHSRKCQ